MNDVNQARPCPICESLRRGRDVVTSIYRPMAFLDHVELNHPSHDPNAAWEMPLPAPGGQREERRPC